MRVGVQSAIAHPEAGLLIRELMTRQGLKPPPMGRTLESICITEGAAPAGYVKDESACVSVAISDGGTASCTIVNTPGDPPVGGIVEIAVLGTSGDEGSSGAALIGLVLLAAVALLSAGSATAWAARRR